MLTITMLALAVSSAVGACPASSQAIQSQAIQSQAIQERAGSGQVAPGCAAGVNRDSTSSLPPSSSTAPTLGAVTVHGAAWVEPVAERSWLPPGWPLGPDHFGTMPWSGSGVFLTPYVGVPTLTVHGIGGGGRNIGFDPRVAVYEDGLYVGPSAVLVPRWWDVERVTLVTGPQGTQSGRAADAGAVYVVHRRPEGRNGAQVSLHGGSQERGVEASWDQGWQRGNDVSWDVHAAVMGLERDGRLRDDAQERSLGMQGQRGARVVVVRQGPRWTWDMAADHTWVHDTAPQGRPVAGFFGASTGPGSSSSVDHTALSLVPRFDVTLDTLRLLGERVDDRGNTLVWQSGRSLVHQVRQQDGDYSPLDIFYTNYRDTWASTSHEVRWNGASDRAWRPVVGAMWAEDVASSQRQALLGHDTGALVPVPGLGWAPFGAVFGLAPGVGAQVDGRVRTRTQAAFAHLDVDVGDRLVVGVGGRVEHGRRVLDMASLGQHSGRLGIATAFVDHEPMSWTLHAWDAAATWHLTPHHDVYAKVADSFKPGGWNVDFLTQAQWQEGLQFGPEHLRHGELGWRYRGQGLVLDAGVFEERARDYQVFSFVPLQAGAAVLRLQNAAQVRSRGAQAGIEWTSPALAHRVDMHAQWLDGRFVHFPNAGGLGVDYDGRRLTDAPRLAMDASWLWSKGSWQTRVDQRYRSPVFVGASNNPTFERLPSLAVTDVSVSWTPKGRDWQVGLGVRNAFDRRDVVSRARDFFGHQNVQDNPGREVDLTWTWTMPSP